MPYKNPADKRTYYQKCKTLKGLCAICQQEFWHSKYKPNAKVCGIPCRNLFNARVSAPKRGDAQRDRGSGKSYRKVMGRHEHRVVAEKALGRPLNLGEIVHHKDEQKRNNKPENLRVFSSQSEHARLHGLWRWYGKDIVYD